MARASMSTSAASTARSISNVSLATHTTCSECGTRDELWHRDWRDGDGDGYDRMRDITSEKFDQRPYHSSDSDSDDDGRWERDRPLSRTPCSPDTDEEKEACVTSTSLELFLQLPAKTFNNIITTLDPASLLGLVGAHEKLRERVASAPKTWGFVERLRDGFLVDWHFCSFSDAIILLGNSPSQSIYCDIVPGCRGLEDLPREMLLNITRPLDAQTFISAVKAFPRFRHTPHRKVHPHFTLHRVTIRGVLQADGSKRTEVRLEGRKYDENTTKFFLNRAKLVRTLHLDPTITDYPEDLSFPKIWEMRIPCWSHEETWPGLLKLIKSQHVQQLIVDNKKDAWKKPAWLEIYKDGTATADSKNGYYEFVINNAGPPILRHLLPMGGPRLRLVWSPDNNERDLIKLWNWAGAVVKRPLETGMIIHVLFHPVLDGGKLHGKLIPGMHLKRLAPEYDPDEGCSGLQDVYSTHKANRPYLVQLSRYDLLLEGAEPDHTPGQLHPYRWDPRAYNEALPYSFIQRDSTPA